MPTVLRSGPYRFSFYSLEPAGEPAHVHVKRDRDEAKIWLEEVALVWSRGFSDRETGAILRLVEEHRTELLNAWRSFFATS